MDKSLTISIAGYNVEKYINDILKSLSESKSLEKIEILVIDDGGTDSTLKIAKQYETLYPDSIIAVHKENGGWGSTVNTALKIGRGKYLKLLDGDDYFDNNGLEALISVLEKEDADLIYTPRVEFEDATGSIINTVTLQKEYTLDSKVSIDVLKNELGLSMHCCTFKMSKLRDSKMRISEKCFYTDFEYLIKGIGCSETIIFLRDPVYYYRLGRDGQSVSISGLKKHYDDQFIVLDELLDYSTNTSCSPEKKSIINSYISLYIDNTLIGITELGRRKDAVELYKKLKDRYNEVYIPRRNRSKLYIRTHFIPALYFMRKNKL